MFVLFWKGLIIILDFFITKWKKARIVYICATYIKLQNPFISWKKNSIFSFIAQTLLQNAWKTLTKAFQRALFRAVNWRIFCDVSTPTNRKKQTLQKINKIIKAQLTLPYSLRSRILSAWIDTCILRPRFSGKLTFACTRYQNRDFRRKRAITGSANSHLSRVVLLCAETYEHTYIYTDTR